MIYEDNKETYMKIKRIKIKSCKESISDVIEQIVVTINNHTV